jgi:hypothetical protein
VFSAFQASVYHPASAKIFYFGGTFEDTLAPGYAVLAYKGWHQFSYALTFDTFSGAWGNQTLNGGVFPTERRFHTTTLRKQQSNFNIPIVLFIHIFWVFICSST